MTTWNYQSTSSNIFSLLIDGIYSLEIDGSSLLLIEDDTPTVWSITNKS